jgi:hypothetical protein
VSNGDVGVDLFYNLTPALRANVSVNTDFAETEVDDRQVNLTRFPLFFQEKRDFFLQGSSYFDFARDPGNAVTPFFSRRIGLDERGQPQRIDVAGKLTGQAGVFDIGVLQARTGPGTGHRGEDFTVARVRGRMLEQSFLGGLYTRRAAGASGQPDRHTAGLDLVLRTSTLRGRDTAELSAFYLWTSTPAGLGDSAAYGVRAQYPNDPFSVNFAFRELQPNYAPAVGFLQRVAYRRWNPDAAYVWRPAAHPWFREFEFEADLTWTTDLDNRSLTHELSFTTAAAPRSASRASSSTWTRTSRSRTASSCRWAASTGSTGTAWRSNPRITIPCRAAWRSSSATSSPARARST